MRLARLFSIYLIVGVLCAVGARYHKNHPEFGQTARVFSETVFDTPQTDEGLITGNLTRTDTTCQNPRVVSQTDSAAELSDGSNYGRVVNADGSFKAIVNKELITRLNVYDGGQDAAGKNPLCLGAVIYPGDTTVTIDAVSTAKSSEAFADTSTDAERDAVAARPTFVAFQTWLAVTLHTEPLSKIMTEQTYIDYQTSLESGGAAQ